MSTRRNGKTVLKIAILAVAVVVALTTCSLFGPSDEEIHEGAITAFKAMNNVTSIWQEDGELPKGAEVDDSDFDWEQGGGAVVVTLSEYELPKSDAIVSGEITVDMTFSEDYTQYESQISGDVSYSGLAVETCVIDLDLAVDMEDGMLWDTATWSGSITVDDNEADVDAVMAEYIELAKEAGS